MNQGTVNLTAPERGLFHLKWEQSPFDEPIGVDKEFSHVQTVITLPHYTKEITDGVNGEPDQQPGALKPKSFATLRLQEYGAMEQGEVTLGGPLKLRMRWSPEMMAAGAVYALLKIQNVANPGPEPFMDDIKKLLYHLDDATYILKTSVRRSPEYHWMLKRAKALSHAFWQYRKDPKYAPQVSVEKFAEHRELVTSLTRFLGDAEAREQATEIINIFKRHRYPMNPVNMLQIIKKMVTKALKASGDQLDVARYDCTLSPAVPDAEMGRINFTVSCTKEEIEDPA